MRSSFGKVFMGAAGGVDLPSDDQFNRVSFLSHFEGSNNGVNNVFDDGSSSNHTITANGNVTQGSFGPFARPDGEWGVRFPQGHWHYCDIPSSSDFAIGANDDFTFEFFIFYDTKDSDVLIMDYRTGGSNGTFPGIFLNGNLDFNGNDNSANAGKIVYNPHPSTIDSVLSASTLTFGAWNHVAIVRNSGTINYYINGTRDNNSYTNNTTVATAADIRLGSIAVNQDFPDLQFSGILSNFRFVNGTAVYSGSSITVPTSKLTAITNTKFLVFQSNRFVDNSASGHTVPVSAGSPAVTAFGPFLTSKVYKPAVNGASAYFDGNGDYLTAGDSTDYEFGAGDFTIEAWVYASSVDNPAIVSKFPNGARQFSLELSRDSNNHARYRALIYIGESGVFSNEYIAFNAWNHIAIVGTASDTTARIYTNGIRNSNTISYSNGVPAGGTDPLRVGSRNSGGSFYYEGYICDLRLLKGTAAYSGASFTLPTAPLTAITNTKLLLNMADGQAIDSAAQNNLTLAGTAKLSTTQAKFGDTSILFDGNSDFLTFPHSESNDISGAGNWTVEFFWRFVDNNATQYQEIATKGIGFQIYGNNGALSIALSANNTTTYFLSANNGTTLSDNTWYHIAAVKNGTAYNVYLNGTNEANLDGTSSSNVDTGTDPWCLGAYTSNSYYANGYMDEFRVSHFARYTSNFTAPTKAFADKGQ